MKQSERIDIVGADVNNLAGISVALPRHALTAVVGVSGSGKSSLVEGTLAAEGASRMRRFLDIDLGMLADKAQTAYVGSLPPMLFAGQGAFRASSRTTLATCTGVLRLLRRLFTSLGRPFASEIGEPVPDADPEVFARWLKAHAEGRAIVWAVPVLNQAVDGVAAAKRLKAVGLQTVTVRSETDRGKTAETGKRIELAHFKPLRSDVRHTLESEVSRFNLADADAVELTKALSKAWEAAPGGVFVELTDSKRQELRGAYSFGLDARIHMVHPKSPSVYVRANQHLLTFNSPDHLQSGACPACLGIGISTGLNERLLVAHPSRSMHEGAMVLWTPKNYRYVNIQHETIEGLRGRAGFDPDKPWKSLPASAKELILDGSDAPVEDRDLKTRKKASSPHSYLGFRRAILERANKPTPAGEALRTYVAQGTCHSCNGSRWSAQARALRVEGRSIDALLGLTVAQLADATSKEAAFSKELSRDAKGVLEQVHRIASSLVDVGLGHLSPDRGMLDISDGESRRVPLAGVLGSRLEGLLLVLDEPARGLHEHDLVGLGNALCEASKRHTVVMSEHRQRLVSRADHLIELGPGAGAAGGRVVADGPVRGTSWSHPVRVPSGEGQRSRAQRWLEMTGVEVHNVQGESVRIPLGTLCCIAGVSGSGKSSFVRGALVPALAETLRKDMLDIEDFRIRRGAWRSVGGAQHVKSLHALDQAPSGANRRSLVSTYLGLADIFKRVFAAQPTAKALGLSASDFGTNSGRGRCQRCQGLGKLQDSADCPVCGGLRFGTDVLSVRVAGLNMADVLGEPLATLISHDAAKSLDLPVLASALELGVGYLSLGRSLDTLSGGEIQRLRIARALAKPDSAGALFVLDEPAGGLHPDDVKQLLTALRHMVADGKNTVVLVEHDPFLLASCDYIVEFGPMGGPNGGKVVATGSPQELAKRKTATGAALAGKAGPKAALTSKSKQRATTYSRTTRALAIRARAELRQISGDDVIVPDDDEGVVRPAAIIPNANPPERPHEIAGLDTELASLLLDARSAAASAPEDELIAAWKLNPNQNLQICPLVDAIAVWGNSVPRSVIKQTNAHMLDMGLGPRAEDGTDAARARATGARFAPGDRSDAAFKAALRDALVLGGGYAELVDEKRRVKTSVCVRPMELTAGLVGPRHPAAQHFTRSHAEGRCPMCSGEGFVWTIDSGLVVKKRSGKLLDLDALVPQAAAILKGVWRSEFGAFFQRLAREGLWDEKLSWDGLDKSQEATVLYGFWARPGHGTFVKVGSANDGSEVRHWLRWDGLVSALMTQIERSGAPEWAERVRASRKRAQCPQCDGTALGAAARLLNLGDRSLHDWTKTGTVETLATALSRLTPLPERARLRRDRILECLRPFRGGKITLRQPAEESERRAALVKSAATFTGMQLALE